MQKYEEKKDTERRIPYSFLPSFLIYVSRKESAWGMHKEFWWGYFAFILASIKIWVLNILFLQRGKSIHYLLILSLLAHRLLLGPLAAVKSIQPQQSRWWWVALFFCSLKVRSLQGDFQVVKNSCSFSSLIYTSLFITFFYYFTYTSFFIYTSLTF